MSWPRNLENTVSAKYTYERVTEHVRRAVESFGTTNLSTWSFPAL